MQLNELSENETHMDSTVAQIESRMLQEADAQLVERIRLVQIVFYGGRIEQVDKDDIRPIADDFYSWSRIMAGLSSS